MGLSGKALGRARWFAAFTLLFVSSAVPVIAETSPPREAPQPPAELPEGALPDGAQVTRGLLESETREAIERRKRETPAAVEEREASLYAFDDVSPAEARALLRATFAEQLALIDRSPARLLSDARIKQVLSPNSARVELDGETLLMDGTGPVRVPEEDGSLGKVNLDLVEAEAGYVLENGITEVTFPDVSSEGMTIGRSGLAITPVITEPARSARLLNGEDLFYFEVQRATDLLASPVSGGIELSSQLRSVESPEELRFDITLPPGAELRADGSNGAEIARDGEILAKVSAPIALDAQGADVPVSLEVEDDSIVERIEHQDMEVAYPIFVDPTITEYWWDTGNWYSGYGPAIKALEDKKTWIWSTNNELRFGYGTWPQFHEFGGSNRGLFFSATNAGSQPANQYGHWSYTVPNMGSSTYIHAAGIGPFNRYDHNCSQQAYPQPHDYVGIWSPTWSPQFGYVTHHANYATVGFVWEVPDPNNWLGKTGKVLNLGIGTGTGGGKIPCWRDVYVGGVIVFLNDFEQPELTTSSTGQWMDNVPVRLNVSARDYGLGVKSFSASATNASGATQTWWTNHSCSGLHSSPCPFEWNLASAPQPMLVYDPSVLPEGIRTLSVTARDALGELSTTTNGMTIRVDHSAPTIALSGTLTEQATLGSAKPKYALKVDAKDGDANNPRSGVSGVVIKVDGIQVDSYQPGCSTQSCSVSTAHQVEYADYAYGHHVARIEATDALGHTAVKELGFALTGDTTAPTLALSGPWAESTWPNPIGPYGGISATAKDGGAGVTSLKLKVDGKVLEEVNQSCPKAACSLTTEFLEDLSEEAPGLHILAVVATDAAGKSKTTSRLVNLDLTPPEISLSGDLSEHEGKVLPTESGSLDIEASEEGSEASSGISKIAVELDGEPVQDEELDCGAGCPETALATYTYDRSEVGPGPHTITVAASDRVGNTETSALQIDVPAESGDAPDCAEASPAVVDGEEVLSAATAAELVEESLPQALEETVPTVEEATETPVDPTYELEAPSLLNRGSLADGRAAVEAAGGFAIDGVLCMAPTTITDATIDADLVAEDAALYANTAPATDTIIRPSALGTTIVQSLRSPDAPSSFSWTVDLAGDQQLVELPSGVVAITQPSDAPWEDTLEYSEPPGIETPTILNDAGLQFEAGEYQIAQAQSETTEEVVAVLPVPWVRTAEGQTVPALIEVAEDTITINLPPELDPETNPNPTETYPMHMLMATVSSLNGRCPKGASPCGRFDAKAAARYAVYWGNPAHPRNPYYKDFGANNCTNFVSQILDKGGMHFMRYDERGDGSWWYKRDPSFPWNKGSGLPFVHGESTKSWRLADKLPRHLWRYGLVHIDRQDPTYWTKGTILAEDWYPSGGIGDFNHVQFVVGTVQLKGERVPLVANESSYGNNYSARSWYRIRQDINSAYGSNGWDRVPLVVKHSMANLREKKHAPENLYGPKGVFSG